MRPEIKCCIDASVWVKYACYKKSHVLAHYITSNRLIVYADNYLLSEIHETLITGFDFSAGEADQMINYISAFVLITAPRNTYRLCPDPEDNFLYDICIQNNCRYLITIDGSLLKDKNAPFIRKTDAWLKRRKEK